MPENHLVRSQSEPGVSREPKNPSRALTDKERTTLLDGLSSAVMVYYNTAKTCGENTELVALFERKGGETQALLQLLDSKAITIRDLRVQ